MNGTNTFSRIERAYVEAMHHFWSNDVSIVCTEDEPLSSAYTTTRIHNPFAYRVVDSCTVNEGTGMCNGNTTVFERDDSGLCVPVFALNYYGWYSEEGLIFLEHVMKETFTKGNFYAGRGPAEMFSSDRKMVYTNGLARDGKLGLQFAHGHSDRERIVRIDDSGVEQVLGVHYFNLVLLTKKLE